MGPLGILGGGQLGRMTLQAASRLGIDVIIAERFPDSPAARLTSHSLVFPHGWDDAEALDRLASMAQVVTLESEFVDYRVLNALAERGVRVLPSPACVGVVQDKLLQKQALALAELPVPMFVQVAEPSDLEKAAAELGWPIMLKARRDGYDGRGNIVVHTAAEAESAFLKLKLSLGSPQCQLYAESFADFDRELASLVVRGLDGAIVQYPTVETRQDSALHICREVLAPAEISAAVAEQAAAIARGAVEAVGGVGAFGVEMFLLRDGQVCINELAPRPHNSAHYTIEACWTSQFENHVRAVLEMPLGSPELRAPAAAMVNLLGTTNEPVRGALLASAGTFVHLYGKRENRPGRKMGHVTSVGSTVDEAVRRARSTAAQIEL